jgi:MOSC domain-containing protein YiiM
VTAVVDSVCRDDAHRFSKIPTKQITVIAGVGVASDAHAGVTVQHRSRVSRDPSQPNLRQVHLVHRELLDALNERGFRVGPGTIGENITTAGIDLLGLPTGTRLRIGADAVVQVTGLRNPCHQLDDYQRGLQRAVLDRAADGSLIRLAGIMAVVIDGGVIRPGDPIAALLPPEPHTALKPV